MLVPARCAATLILVLCSALAVGAQGKVTVKNVDVRKVSEATATAPARWVIRVKFSKTLDAGDVAAALMPQNYSILDTASKRYVPVCGEPDCAPQLAAPTNTGRDEPANTVKFQVADNLNVLTKDQYYVLVSNLTFGGTPLGKNLLASLPVKDGTATTGGEEADKYDAAKDRDDANYYFTGEVTRASGTDFNGSADLKVKQPFFTDWWGTSHSVGPFFELKASTDPKADPDSLEFGVDWKSRVGRARGPLQGVFWINKGKVEAERDFDNANLVWDTTLRFALKPLQNKHAIFYMRPYFGFELGKNIRSPLAEAEGKGLARGIGGTSLNLFFPFDEEEKRGISLEAIYERRWLLKREVSFEEADDKTLRAVTFGTNPRDWAEAKLNFKFTKFFGTYIGYEYGEQPPSFKLVDHKMKMGLIFSAKRKKEE